MYAIRSYYDFARLLHIGKALMPEISVIQIGIMSTLLVVEPARHGGGFLVVRRFQVPERHAVPSGEKAERNNFV